MKHLLTIKLLLVALFTPHLANCMHADKNKPMTAVDGTTIPLGKFHDTMRVLWNDHGVWTRESVMAATGETPNLKAVNDRLMRNQEDIGNALGKFYGLDAGKKLTTLLKEHIKIATEVVKAAKAGNKKELDTQNKLWHKNADDIAAFLSKANPHLPQKGVQKMLYDHLARLTADVKAIIAKDWYRDIKAYDAYRTQLNEMADGFSSAIALQFPAKFQKKTPWYKKLLPGTKKTAKL